jgi:hypothetical protein
MSEVLLEIVGNGLGRALLWVILLPISWLLATPVILLIACLQAGPYRQNVRNGYRRVFEFWDGAVTIVP